MKEKMEDEDMPHGMDTTIYLVEKVATAQGSRSNKRIQREETESVQAEEKLVEKVYVDSRRLRECSKNFETCMDDRWARSKPAPSQLEFHLELQADVVYYRDCFSRMEPGSLLQPIPSVNHCLELLKVASQIVFQEVVDLGIKYLSATPWSANDEVKIRRFCESGHISLDSEAHGDLIARLRMSLTEKTHGEVLSLYLEHVSSKWATPEPEDRCVFEETFQIFVSGPNRHAVIESVQKDATRLLFSLKKSNDNFECFAWLYGLLRSINADQSIFDLLLKETDKLISKWATPEDCRVFEETFQTIVSGPNRHAVIESVKKEATRLLLSFKESNIEGFAWLYGLLRNVHADQSVVDLLLKKTDIFKTPFMAGEYCEWRPVMAWIKLIGGMLQDVLDGRLFLTSSERYTLFIHWRHICEEGRSIWDVFGDRDLRKLFTTFLMTFPFQEQMRIMESWGGMDKFQVLVNEVYGKWRMCLINDLASRRGQEVTAADSREPSDSAE
jgi:hypothetical protein